MESLWERVKETVDEALDLAQKFAKTAGEKTKEAAGVAKLRLEIASWERKLTRLFTELGIKTYEWTKEKQVGDFWGTEMVNQLASRIKGMEIELEKLKKKLEVELQHLKSTKSKT